MATSKTANKKSSTKGGAETIDPTTGDPREGLTTAEVKKPIHMNTVGPKRKLAFALVGVMALVAKQIEAGVLTREDIEADPNYAEAKKALAETGYADLKPRAEREAELREQLKAAAEAGDLKEVQRLAKVLKAVQDGRPEPGQPKEAADESEA